MLFSGSAVIFILKHIKHIHHQLCILDIGQLVHEVLFHTEAIVPSYVRPPSEII